VVVYLTTTLLQIFHRICGWKNFENRRIFGEDMDKSLQLTFFGPPCTSVLNWCCNFYLDKSKIQSVKLVKVLSEQFTIHETFTWRTPLMNQLNTDKGTS